MARQGIWGLLVGAVGVSRVEKQYFGGAQGTEGGQERKEEMVSERLSRKVRIFVSNGMNIGR